MLNKLSLRNTNTHTLVKEVNQYVFQGYVESFIDSDKLTSQKSFKSEKCKACCEISLRNIYKAENQILHKYLALSISNTIEADSFNFECSDIKEEDPDGRQQSICFILVSLPRSLLGAGTGTG